MSLNETGPTRLPILTSRSAAVATGTNRASASSTFIRQRVMVSALENGGGPVGRSGPVTGLAAPVGRRVLDDAIGLSAVVVLRQVLGDRQSLRRDEQQTVTVFVLFHLVAGTDPAAAVLVQLRLLVGIEVARAQRFAQHVEVQGEALDHRLADLGLRVRRRPRLGAILLDVGANAGERCFRRVGGHRCFSELRAKPLPQPPPRDGEGEKDLLLPLSASGRGLGGGVMYGGPQGLSFFSAFFSAFFSKI